MINDMTVPDMEQACPTIKVSDVLEKYVIVSRIVNKALEMLLEQCKPGAEVSALCDAGDDYIEKECAKFYSKKKLPRGVAFPTCVCVNNVVANCAPMTTGSSERKGDEGDESIATASVMGSDISPGFTAEKAVVIAEGDVVRFDVAGHIDGFVATVSHTTIACADERKPPEVDDQLADIMVATQTAVDEVIKMLRPGTTNAQATDMIRKVADAFGVEPVEGVLSHRMAGGVIDGQNTIICRRVVDHEPQQDVETFTFGLHQVWAINVALSSGSSRLRQSADHKTTIWKRNEVEWEPKRKASRTMLQQLSQRVVKFPFHQRIFGQQSVARLGLFELSKLAMLEPYPVMCSKSGDYVARVKVTVLITEKGPKVITGHSFPEWIRSTRSYATEQQSTEPQPMEESI